MNYIQRLIQKQLADDKTDKVYPDFKTAAKEAEETGNGIIYHSRGFFCVIWFEYGLRFSRDLKNWGIKGSSLPKVRLMQAQHL